MGQYTPRELISARTGAVTTEVPFELTADRVPALLMAHDLATSEEVDILVSYDGGTNWVTYTESTTAVTLVATGPFKVLTAPGLYGVLKDATAGAAGVFISYL